MKHLLSRVAACFLVLLTVIADTARDVGAAGVVPLSAVPTLLRSCRFETQALSLIPVFCPPGYWEGPPVFPATLMASVSPTRDGPLKRKVEEVPVKKVRLSDGRDLSYREYGDLDSAEVFNVVYVSGNGGTSAEPQGFSIQNQDLHGIRVTAVDVPGIGESTAKSNLTLESWAQDILEFADLHFGKDSKFFLYGFSAGARYAQACDEYPPLESRILGVELNGGLGPVNHLRDLWPYNLRMMLLYSLARLYSRHSEFQTPILRLAQILWVDKVTSDEKFPEAYETFIVRGQSSEDQRILHKENVRESVMWNLRENLKQGADAWMRYMAALTMSRPRSDIRPRIVIVRHGSEDKTVPFAVGERVARELGVTVTRIEGQGHRFIFEQFTRNVRELVELYVARTQDHLSDGLPSADMGGVKPGSDSDESGISNQALRMAA